MPKRSSIEFKKLSEIATLKRGQSISQNAINIKKIKNDNICNIEMPIKKNANNIKNTQDTQDIKKYPIISGGRVPTHCCENFNATGETITIASSGTAGYIAFWEVPIFVCDAFFVQAKESMLTKFIYYYLKNAQDKIYNMRMRGAIDHIYIRHLRDFKIPILPLKRQEEIIKILDSFTHLNVKLIKSLECELESRETQYAHCRNILLNFKTTKFKKLGEICKIETGKKNAKDADINGAYKFFTTAQKINKINTFNWDTEALLIAGNANVGDVKYFKGKFDAYQRVYVLSYFSESFLPKFLYFYIECNLKNYLKNKTNTSALSFITLGTLEDFKVPDIAILEQIKIIKKLDELSHFYDEIKEKITQEIDLRNKIYKFYSNKLLNFE